MKNVKEKDFTGRILVMCCRTLCVNYRFHTCESRETIVIDNKGVCKNYKRKNKGL